MSLGEKIETIIYSRKSGEFGEFLNESNGSFGRVQIDGVVYRIIRHIEADSPFFWQVVNEDTNNVVSLKEEYDLCALKSA